MKRNTILYLVVFVALAITAVVLLLKKSETTLPKVLSDFAVEDTASITKLHLTDHFKNDITLERKGSGSWMLNGKYNVKQSNIQVLLETIREIRVKNPVPLPARQNVIKDLAVNGIKIEIFKGAGLAKCYYVGSSTPDDEGTLMVLQGSSEPFVTWVPGFVGYLTTRYITKEQDWRSSELYHLNPADITSVTVDYPADAANSFKLVMENNAFTVLHPNADAIPARANELIAKKYLVGFKYINFESFPELRKNEQDSILKTRPYAIVKVTTVKQKLPDLILYPKYADDKTKDVGKGNTDLNRFYGTIGENSREIVMIQTYVIGKLLAHYSDLATGK
jgi:hypothetical protein